MSIAITNKQRREIVRLEYRFISRQVRGNRLLIHGRSFGGALRDIQKSSTRSAVSLVPLTTPDCFVLRNRSAFQILTAEALSKSLLFVMRLKNIF